MAGVDHHGEFPGVHPAQPGRQLRRADAFSRGCPRRVPLAHAYVEWQQVKPPPGAGVAVAGEREQHKIVGRRRVEPSLAGQDLPDLLVNLLSGEYRYDRLEVCLGGCCGGNRAVVGPLAGQEDRDDVVLARLGEQLSPNASAASRASAGAKARSQPRPSEAPTPMQTR